MKKKIKFIAVCLISFLLTSLITNPLPKKFDHLMTRAKMMFNKPNSLIEVEIKNNYQMNYEYALTYPGKHFEVRYAIRPLDSLLSRYYRDTVLKEKNGFSLNPNKLYNTFFRATLLNIFGKKLPSIKLFSKDAVENGFNADWGAIAGSQVIGAFGEGYRFCSVVAIHKDNAGDAYYFYLADSTVNGQEFGKLMKPLFYALKFK